MSQASVVAWLAVRELWMSFRLFVILAVHVVAGASVAVLPVASLPVTVDRLALALGGAAAITAAVAASTVAIERWRGRTGWLVARSIARETVLTGWFAGIAGTALVGHGLAVVIGWVLALGLAAQPDPLGYAVAALATLAATLTGIGLGVVAGLALRPVVAALGTVTAAAILGVVTVVGPIPAALVPGAGAFAILGRYGDSGSTIGPGLVAAGVSLGAAAALLVAARFVLERADL